MPRPFELSPDELAVHLEEMVDATFADLQSQFLVLPKGSGFIEYGDFQSAYEVLKRSTDGFRTFTIETVWAALVEDSLTFVVLRTILGLSAPEWVDLAKSEIGVSVPQGVARGLDRRVRSERQHLAGLRDRPKTQTYRAADALVRVAVQYIASGPGKTPRDTIHRLAKVDTMEGLSSLQHAAATHVPYAVLLYERYLGRPFASHRDSVSEHVGDVMESAIEARLAAARITFRKTKRAERVPGFDQAPDFFVPDEFAAALIIEAKITGDDGTARDKVARVLRLAQMRDRSEGEGRPFQLVACIDGRGFGVRRQDMRDMLIATKGKVFTLATLDHLIPNTDLRNFLPKR